MSQLKDSGREIIMRKYLQKNTTDEVCMRADGCQRMSTKILALIGVMTALICILGPISLPLPVSPVPISLGTLAIYFAIYVLGMKQGTISCCVYLLIGLVGVPVFTGFTGGPAKLLGPTGGYMIGYIFMALIGGWFIDKWNGEIVYSFVGLLLATIVLYAFGTVWLAYQAGMGFGAALMAGVIPFIPGDLAKMIIAVLVGVQVRSRLKKAKLL